jgi:hypothetical protein
METVDRPTTRRALLAAAAGGAAALAAQAVAPLAVSATDTGPVVLGEPANTATHTTGITTAANPVDTFAATAGGDTGAAIVATKTGTHGSGVVATSATEAAIYAANGDTTDAATPDMTTATGIYGYAPGGTDTAPGTGVWGDSPEVGVYGSGDFVGVGANGYFGVFATGDASEGYGVAGNGYIGVNGETGTLSGTGVLGVAGAAAAIGVVGVAAASATPATPTDPGHPASIGVHARADAAGTTALKVSGKVAFSRSGKTPIAAGVTSKVISDSRTAGVTANSLIFAVLATNRSGRWVRAVVPGAGKFTVYLNTSVASGTSYLVWWIIN